MLLAGSVVLSLLFISNLVPLNEDKGLGFGNGLDYGLDFAGGIQIQLRLEEPVDSNVMSIEKGILENRLNSMGLKDIPVRPWGDQYILVQVAGASPEETTSIEEILKQQARFEERIDGQLAVTGDEVTVDLTPRGSTLQRLTNGYQWGVSVQHDKEGACRFGAVADGKKGRPVDMFIDRPANSTIVLTESDYMVFSNLTSFSESDTLYFGDTALDVIQKRARIPVVSYGGDNLTRLMELKRGGMDSVILAGDENTISDSYRNLLEENGFETERIPQMNLSEEDWILELTGMQSSPTLNFNTRGECVYNAQITGTAATLEAAEAELKQNQVLLTSGNLPVKASIESKSTTPPRLGERFLKYSFLTGVVALLTVAAIILLRYRKAEIVLPLVGVGLSEILIILGLAALINWELDLPAVAGIIAAVGTGVDHLIVITDETLQGGRQRKKKQIVMVTEQIKRAFFIIFTAASTTIAAMVPIMTIGAGMLRGFAFTTIMGVLVGVLIARPTYAKILEELIRGK